MKKNVFQFEPDRPIDLICMGRVAVDLYAEQIGSELAEAESFHKYLGGCAGNIAVGTARLGLKSLMFSCVGKDEMGKFLKNTLKKEGVAIDLLYETANHLTGLVLLGVKPPSDFPLMFYRKDCADMQLRPEHADAEIIGQAKAILITGTALSTESMFATTLHVVELARKLGTKIIFDLDFRPVLWQLTTVGNGETRYIASAHVSETYQKILPYCDLIVGTEEEIAIAGGFDSKAQALATLRSLSNAPIVVKLGVKGCQIHFAQASSSSAKPFPVEVLNVLGAGDGFMSGLLRGLLTGADWQKAMRFANAAGALVVTRHGCSPAIPYWDELNYFMEEFAQNPLVWKSQRLAQLHQQDSLNQASPILIKNPLGFDVGLNPILKTDENDPHSLMNFYSLKLHQGQSFRFNPRVEFAALLMTGRVIFNFDNQSIKTERADYFSQPPRVLHGAAGLNATVNALTDCEILLIETENDRYFAPVFFNEHNSVEIDHRGKDLLDDTSYRIVRTVFDKRNRPESNLVVGEIITFQGRWSSYPSHYHSQPEIYHYRFSEPQGYAFGENGAETLRIEQNDTYQISQGQTHAHCTAPGYALYTLWFIRHQEENPYLLPTFLPQHAWTRDSSSNRRVWKLKENHGDA
ncbi:5-dehydro-2-deoxygluconokinase [Legionella massiliensis]|uniref:5-dehydro-2-deoxygluconokinase n=1 Tax=Legionella massiliensis TaxID=1034943 RepID=A0A078KSG9_9GAMM|nr:5-dehydro-2-deoxygluconokinase [Legionella massiliensis]CDZ77395.1 5-dehydro-2-deoxygluconokinase [Legionella massiliensis]CEE13133.1 5-dehydro-2-deoxygluconokinase [Legionella massiliensis]